MSSNHLVIIQKNELELYFKELAKIIRKKLGNKHGYCEIIVVGGASILLNYNFRESTANVDCLDEQGITMNDLISQVAEKYDLPNNWINTDFKNTKSYSSKISEFSSYYRSYANDTLIVRTIKDEYLVAMKIVSGRKYKNDFSDIYGIINECRDKRSITIDMINNALVDLYGTTDIVDKEAYEFAKDVILNPDKYSYEYIRKMELDNNTLLVEKIEDINENESDIEYILSKLEIK